MTQTAYPKVGSSTTDDQFRALFRLLADSGVVGNGDLAVTGDSSGMQVKVASGMGVVDGIVANNSAQVTLAVGAAPGAGLSRIDTVVEQLDYTKTPICQLVLLPGTPAATGDQVPPSLDPTGNVKYNLPLGDVAVGPTTSTIAAGAVTDRRSFIGSNVGRWTTDLRPKSPRDYQLGINLTSGQWEYYDPTTASWKPLGLDAAQIITGTLDSARLPTVPISKGGTGATTKTAARQALGIFVQSTPLDGSNEVGDLRFW